MTTKVRIFEDRAPGDSHTKTYSRVLWLAAGAIFIMSGLVAWAIRNQIMMAKSCGLDVFDFNGANSPSRGDDKHSYGAKAALFFEIALSKGE